MEIIIYIIFIIIAIIVGLYFGIKELSQIIYGYGVPFVPTSDYKIEKLLSILSLKKGQKFLDLGSGDGRILEVVGKNFKGVKLYGIENSPFPFKESLKRKKQYNLDYTVYKKDFFLEDFGKYDVIYSYTIPYLMEKIWEKIKKDCKKGTLFYSNSFEIKGKKTLNKTETTKGRYIYIYEV